MYPTKVCSYLQRCTSALMLLCLVLSALPANAQTTGRLHINEIMVANIDRFLDTSWNYGSWVEIYNSSLTDINLNRYYINTSNSNREKTRIGYDLVIPARGHVVLWFARRKCSGPGGVPRLCVALQLGPLWRRGRGVDLYFVSHTCRN